VSSQLDVPAALTLERESPGTHQGGGWISPRSRMDALEKRKNLLPPTPGWSRSAVPLTYMYKKQKVTNMYFQDFRPSVWSLSSLPWGRGRGWWEES